MAADSTLPLQAAIVAALKADGGFSALVSGRVHDRTPEGVVFPYVSLGVEQGEPFDAAAMAGWDVSWQIDTWSRKPGKVEARQIMAAVNAALHEATLTVDGHQFIRGVLEFQTALSDPDGLTTHGVQRFRFITHL